MWLHRAREAGAGEGGICLPARRERGVPAVPRQWGKPQAQAGGRGDAEGLGKATL